MRPNVANGNPVRLLMRIPVPWVFVLCYLAGVGLERIWPSPRVGSAMDLRVTVAGAVVFGVGAIIAGWALVIFRRSRTTTVPGRRSSRLVTWGPYRFGRNPMYVGLTLAYLGEAALLKQIWPAVLLPLTLAYLNWMVIPVEEAKLTEVFGGEYDAYRARVRRWA